MSFILDALKKSETERLRKNPPGIANIAESSRRKSSSKWMWMVLALLAVNLVAIAGLILLARPEPAVVQAPAATIQQDAGALPAASSGRVTAIEREKPAVLNVEAERVPVEVAAEPAGPAVTAVSAEQTGTVYDGLDTFNDLRAKGQLMLPDLHLDIHVYSGRVADRFVFVNMRKYKEKAALLEGPVVREITPDGVVLDYQGTVFLLPRE